VQDCTWLRRFVKPLFRFVFVVFLCFSFFLPHFPISLITPVKASTANWYDTSYKYRRAITIDNTGNDSALTNYQVKVALTSSNFDFTRAQSAGQDIRFTDNDGITLLNYYIETYDSSALTATIWVKVPNITASSTYTIYQYYGNSTTSSISSGSNTFAFFDDFETKFGDWGALANASTYLTTPTYDGSNQAIHPDIVKFDTAWNGYLYWMTMTPYPNGNANYENPSIIVSNDGSTWTVPSGLTNPIATPPSGHYADTDLVYNSETNELVLFWGNGGSTMYYSKSSDGINWSATAESLTSGGVSPAIIYKDGTYQLWYVSIPGNNNNSLKYRTSTDAVNWSTEQSVTYTQDSSTGYMPWHINVIWVPEKQEYWLLDSGATVRTKDKAINRDTRLFFAKSSDGLNWTSYPRQIIQLGEQWDNYFMYRATGLYDNQNNKIRIWYSALSGDSSWHTGYTEGDYDTFLSNVATSIDYNNYKKWTDYPWVVGDSDKSGGTFAYTADRAKFGSGSVRVTQQARVWSEAQHYIRANKTISTVPSNFIAEWYMYDNLLQAGFKVVRISKGDYGNNLGMGVWRGSSSVNYVYQSSSGYTVTSVSRSEGWHKFGIALDDQGTATFFIDDVNVGSKTGQTAGRDTVNFQGYVGDQTDATSYSIDQLVIRSYSSPDPAASVGSENSQILSGISLNNNPTGQSSGRTRITGNANTGNSSYTVSDVHYSVNGGSWQGATATDGSFNTSIEDFYFDFLPTDNNYSLDGYTVRVKSQNSSGIWQDNLFYFKPFNLDSPSNNAYTTNSLPTFSFTVNKGRFQDLKDNLSKFQVLINKDNKGWQTYIADIPVDFTSVQNNDDNLQKNSSSTNGNGVYENNKIYVVYSNNNASISVYSKAVDSLGNSSDKYFEDGGHKLSSGSYQWKIVAVDKAGHSQESETRKLRVNAKQVILSQKWFPLTVEYIQGIGKLDLSTIHPEDIKDKYTTSYFEPTIRGIANAGTAVTLEKVDETCESEVKTDCTYSYTATTDTNSRYTITFPKNSLRYGRPYRLTISVKDTGDNYNELPSFKLIVGEEKKELTQPTPSREKIEQEVIAIPTLKSIPTPSPTPKPKRCFLFICW